MCLVCNDIVLVVYAFPQSTTRLYTRQGQSPEGVWAGPSLSIPLKNLELIIKNIFFYFDQEIVEFFFIIEWKKKMIMIRIPA